MSRGGLRPRPSSARAPGKKLLQGSIALLLVLLSACDSYARIPAEPPPAATPRVVPQGWYALGGPPGAVYTLARAAGSSGLLLAGTQEGVYFTSSSSEASSWQQLGSIGAGGDAVTSLLATQAAGEEWILAGTRRGLWRIRLADEDPVTARWGRVDFAGGGRDVEVYSLATFRGQIYVATAAGLFELAAGGGAAAGPDRRRLVPPAYGGAIRVLLAVEDGLLAASGAALWRFAGPDLEAGGTGKPEALQLEPGVPGPPIYDLAARDGLLVAATGRGLFASRDRGVTWGLLAAGAFRAVTFRQHATAEPSVIGGREDGSLWASGGAGGEDVPEGLPAREPLGHGLPPATLHRLLSVTWQGGDTLFAAGDGGIYYSLDGGAGWRGTLAGLPRERQVGAVAALRLADGSAQLFAATGAGIFRSDQAGQQWQQASAGLPAGGVSDLAVAAADPFLLVAATGAGLYQTSDGGSSWRRTAAQPGGSVSPASVQRLWVAPGAGVPIYAAGSGGLFVSRDGLASWESISGGLPPGSEVTALLATGDGATLYAGLRFPGRADSHAGGARAIWVGEDGPGGHYWRSAGYGASMLAGAEDYVAALAQDPAEGGSLYAATAAGRLFAARRGPQGLSWEPAQRWLPEAPDGVSSAATMNTPPGRPEILYAAVGGAVRRRSGGSWRQLGRPPAGGVQDLVVLGPAFEPVAEGGDEPVTLFAAVRGGGLWRYDDSVPLPAPVAEEPATPASRAAPIEDPNFSYFPETGHNLGWGFRDFWQANGGLRLFGYPITEEFREAGAAGAERTVQYFERVRLEVQPGADGAPGFVAIGLLGREMTADRFFVSARFFVSSPERVYFAATRHSLAHGFLGYWRENGGLTTFGYPISEEIQENGYTVQYFERARFEYRPEFAGTDFEIALGQLGLEALRERGWIE